jgi:hypothetical protein
MFAVQVADAVPLAAVVTVVAESVQFALDEGAENVTVAPLAGDPLLVTVTTNAANAVPTSVLCGVPLVAVIAIVGGGVLTELPPQPVRRPNARQTMAARMKA